MFFNRRATIRCVHDSSTANFGLTSTFEPGAPNRGLERSRQTRSIGCEISRKAIFTSGSKLTVRDTILSPDENPLGFIASEEDESSSEIILQTGTTGLGPIQIISFSEFEDRRQTNWRSNMKTVQIRHPIVKIFGPSSSAIFGNKIQTDVHFFIFQNIL